jgi:hypothetical protein
LAIFTFMFRRNHTNNQLRFENTKIINQLKISITDYSTKLIDKKILQAKVEELFA